MYLCSGGKVGRYNFAIASVPVSFVSPDQHTSLLPSSLSLSVLFFCFFLFLSFFLSLSVFSPPYLFTDVIDVSLCVPLHVGRLADFFWRSNEFFFTRVCDRVFLSMGMTRGIWQCDLYQSVLSLTYKHVWVVWAGSWSLGGACCVSHGPPLWSAAGHDRSQVPALVLESIIRTHIARWTASYS